MRTQALKLPLLPVITDDGIIGIPVGFYYFIDFIDFAV